MTVPAAEVSLLRSAARLTLRSSTSSAASAATVGTGGTNRNPSLCSSSIPSEAKKYFSSTSVDDGALKEYLSSIKSSISSPNPVPKPGQSLLSNTETPSSSTVSSSASTSLHAIFSESLKSVCTQGHGESAKRLSAHVSSMLRDESDLHLECQSKVDQSLGSILDSPWLSKMTNTDLSLRRKSVSVERKQKWVFKKSHTGRFGHLVKMCANVLGSDVTLEVFGRLGRETGLKEYNALINTCLHTAKNSTDEDIVMEQIYKAYQILKLVKEAGFGIEEETYGKFLLYLIELGSVAEFFFFHDVIKDQNLKSHPRLAYYEMLLWVRVKNETKIQELCSSVLSSSAEKCSLQESLLLALSESNCRKEFCMLLETLDPTRVASVATLEHIFRALGKLFLECHAEKLLIALEKSGTGAENISCFIAEYAIGLPYRPVEDVIIKFQALHAKFDVLPTSAQYVKLIRYSCKLLEVHEALNLLDRALESGVPLSLEAFHLILDACDQSYDFNLVHQVFPKLSSHNLKPNYDTFWKMIFLCVRMKDFQGAYRMIEELLSMNLKPTSSLYNIIMLGYFREKNTIGAMSTLKQMEEANVKPDSLTYSYLINNSQSEKDIIKFCDDMSKSGVEPTKHVFMALINAYASCGEIEKAKQVILDKRIFGKDINEIKSALVGALASNGQPSVALEKYEEIKGSKSYLDPKAIRCLIEHLAYEDGLDKSLQLLNEVNDSSLWVGACFSIISRFVQQENLRCVELLKQLKDKFIHDDVATQVMFDEVFCIYAEKEPTDMRFGIGLLEAVKEKLGLGPSRKILDFLLSACVTAKDSASALVIWKEYKAADLPYNILSYLRMYQALLASGDKKSAADILSKIQNDDPHVRCVINACKEAYRSESIERIENKRMKKRALATILGILRGVEPETK